TVSVVWDVDKGLDTGHGFDQFADAVYPGMPFFVELFRIELQPGFNRGKATDNLFFADLHGTADGALIRAAVAQCRVNQVFTAEKHAAALRPAQAFSAREGVQIELHFRVQLDVVDRWNAGGIIKQQWHATVFGDGSLARQLVAEIGGINHRSVGIDGVRDLL